MEINPLETGGGRGSSRSRFRWNRKSEQMREGKEGGIVDDVGKKTRGFFFHTVKDEELKSTPRLPPYSEPRK